MKKFKFKQEYFAFPYALISIIFVIVPLLMLLYYAFTDSSGTITLSNFDSFGEQSLWNTIGRSFLMAILTTLICLLLAYPLAMALCKVCNNKTTILVTLFILPMWINSLLRIYAIKLVFGEIMETGFWFTLLGMVYDFFPFMLMPIFTILSNMNNLYIEASNDLGASPLKTFFKVKLPLSIPGIMSGVLMVFMPTVSTFAVSDILGNTESRLFGNIINQWLEKGYYNVGSALSLVLLVLILITIVISNFISNDKKHKNKGAVLNEEK